MMARKISLKAAVIFSPLLKTYVESTRPSSFAGSAHEYKFEIGPALCIALRRSVETVYQTVIEIDTVSGVGQYDRVIRFSLQNSNIDVYFQSGYFTTTGRAQCMLAVSMEAYDGKNMELIGKTTVSGSGFSSRITNAFTADEAFAKAIEMAIQQISDNVANLLISGFAEPKVNKQVH
jgi:hypothetical protein